VRSCLGCGVGEVSNALFTLEPTGTLKTAVTFDYESNGSTYTVRVEARDEYNATVEGNFTVALTNANEPPVLPQSFSFTLSENNGSSVFLVSASDPDSVSNLIYSLSGPDAGQFMINASTGELSFIQPPDYEAMGSSAGDNLYEFSVSVSDGQSQSNSQIYVEVTDMDETPPNGSPYDLNASVSLRIIENLPAGWEVGRVLAQDPDSDPLTYHLVAGVGDADNAKFLMDSNGTLRSAQSLDFELASALSIRIQAKDPMDASVEAIMLVEVVDLDEVAPVLELIGDANLTHPYGQPFADSGARWTDNADGEGVVTSNLQVDSQTLGQVQLVYEFMDQAGNAAVPLMRVVSVEDLTAPVIELVGEQSIRHPLGLPFVEPGIRALDNRDGNLTNRIQTTGVVDTTQPGVYSLSYRVNDEAGNPALEVIREVVVYNTDPVEVLISQSEVPENRPAGTVVGSLSVVDPNDPQGVGAYQFELIRDSSNSPFAVSSSGALSITKSLDFENQSLHELNLRVSDAFGGSLDKNLSISVIDEFRPIVDTLEVNQAGEFSARASGEILDAGGVGEVIERGVLVAEFPEPKLGDSKIMKFLSDDQIGSGFSSVLQGLKPGTKYYARAFASNEEGVGYGFSLSFETPASDTWPSWSDAQPMAAGVGWWNSPWFGTFYLPNSDGWAMHEALGWVFVLPADSQGIWFWTEGFGWCWTDSETFPYFHRHSTQSWMYLHKGTRGRHLAYDYAEARWIVLNSENQF
ncbi:MAG: cadherin domain-containing protein, partial [Verrucomicrobiota bacterium]|nr:cadherin domain-containing protein [Verrucomicrobiota bacterium]